MDQIHFDADIEKCQQTYFSIQYERSREMICMTKGLTPESLHEWSNAFVIFQISIGECIKTPKDFARHLLLWLCKQNLSIDPKTLNNVAGNQKTGTTYTRPNSAEANNNRQREADDQINRLFGDG